MIEKILIRIIKYLIKLIKVKRKIYTGSNVIFKIHGKEIPFASNVSFDIVAGPRLAIPIIDEFNRSTNREFSDTTISGKS